jgi:predicted nucleic acid-binding protein
MSIGFWDTSALAKRYLPEPGSAWVSRQALAEIVIARLTVVEMASTFRRRAREGQIDERQRDALYARFVNESAGFTVIELSADVLATAAELLLQRAQAPSLRTLDAIQLASALAWFEAARARTIDPGSFVGADQRLVGAAVALGLPVINPEDHA